MQLEHEHDKEEINGKHQNSVAELGHGYARQIADLQAEFESRM